MCKTVRLNSISNKRKATTQLLAQKTQTARLKCNIEHAALNVEIPAKYSGNSKYYAGVPEYYVENPKYCTGRCGSHAAETESGRALPTTGAARFLMRLPATISPLKAFIHGKKIF